MIPVVGVGQPTAMSAALLDGRITPSRERPKALVEAYDGGDGTVPAASAIPIELSEDALETCLAERHSSLHVNSYALGDLLRRIRHMQGSGLAAIRGPERRPAPGRWHESTALDVNDVYLASEPRWLSVRVTPDTPNPPHVEIAPAAAPDQPVATGPLLRDSRAWHLDLGALERGVYRVEARSPSSNTSALHDVFVIT